MAGTQSRGRFGIIGSIFGGTWWAIKGFMVLILTICFYIILLSILGAMGANKGPKVPDGGALILNPSGLVVEQQTEMDPFSQFFLMGGGGSEALVTDIVTAIDRAASDDRITTLVLRLESMNIPMAYASKSYQIAEAIDRFKAAEKEVISIGIGYEQGGYLLASHADEIWMHPYGNAIIQGYEQRRQYMKSFYDNIMVTIHPFKVGEFKSAIEPQTRDDMSPAAKEATMAFMGDMWSEYTTHVEAQRGFAPGTVQDLADNASVHIQANGGDMAKAALATGMVDKLLEPDQWRAAMIEKVGEDKETKSFKQIGYKGYLMATTKEDKSKPSKSNVAVIVAKGSIVNGEAPRGTIGGETVSRLIREAREKDTTKAIVLRVDSGGGSAFASEMIRRELVAAQEQGIPVVASMGSIAASGGYWISSSADKIYAEPTTITGSIGVIGLFMTMENLGDFIGIHGDGVGTTKLAGFQDQWSPINEEFKAIIQSSIDNTYARFINLVVENRDLEEDLVREIAEGRVWSAPDALDHGLIDELGDLEDAVSAAAELAGVDVYRIDYLEKEVSQWDQFIREFQSDLGARIGLDQEVKELSPAQKLFGEVSRELQPLTDFNDPHHVYVVCEECEVR